MPRFPEAFLLMRTCYQHPAGKLGVALTSALEEQGWVERVPEPRWALGAYRVTDRGREELPKLGVDLGAITPHSVHKACADNTERLADGTRGIPHIAGPLGASITQWLLASGGAERLPNPATIYESRTFVLTPSGRERLTDAGLLR